MSVSRWIKFPLLFAVVITVPELIFPEDFTYSGLLARFVFGAIAGLGLQAWSDVRTRRRTKGITDPDIYKVRHERTVTVLLRPEEAFQLCLDAMRSIDGMKLNVIDEVKSQIIGGSRMTWESFGTVVTLNLATIGDCLTEVSIKTRPLLRMTRVDHGESWEQIELLVSYLRRHDANVGESLLDEGTSIINDAARRPIAFDARDKSLR